MLLELGGGGGGACKKKLAFKAGEMGQKIGSEWAVTPRNYYKEYYNGMSNDARYPITPKYNF